MQISEIKHFQHRVNVEIPDFLRLKHTQRSKKVSIQGLRHNVNGWRQESEVKLTVVIEESSRYSPKQMPKATYTYTEGIKTLVTVDIWHSRMNAAPYARTKDRLFVIHKLYKNSPESANRGFTKMTIYILLPCSNKENILGQLVAEISQVYRYIHYIHVLSKC